MIHSLEAQENWAGYLILIFNEQMHTWTLNISSKNEQEQNDQLKKII